MVQYHTTPVKSDDREACRGKGRQAGRCLARRELHDYLRTTTFRSSRQPGAATRKK